MNGLGLGESFLLYIRSTLLELLAAAGKIKEKLAGLQQVVLRRG